VIAPRNPALTADRHKNGPEDATTTHDERLRDLEAAAFRTAAALTGHSEQLATIRRQQHTASEKTGALADTIGPPAEHTITQRLDTTEQQLSTITAVLHALARALAQDTDPDTTT
jgi:hypothetical protein